MGPYHSPCTKHCSSAKAHVPVFLFRHLQLYLEAQVALVSILIIPTMARHPNPKRLEVRESQGDGQKLVPLRVGKMMVFLRYKV